MAGDINKSKLSNLQTDQEGMDESPAEGGKGYVGGNSNASTVGFDYVTGKKGYSTEKSIWSQKSSDGGDSGAPKAAPSGSESTAEGDSAKHVQGDEGLPQTYRTSYGAGDAGPSGSDEPDTEGMFKGVGDGGAKLDTQKIGSEMPQTGFTDVEGGGAPKFKHAG